MKQSDQRAEEVSARVRGNVLDAAAAAGLTGESVVQLTGCRPEALMGESDLHFEELVQIARLVGCSPARFFD
ncbi:hypothetical protein P5G50_18210 [Leifsonia sp. F6_8S_P_1B]|uniref:HTH cro/C1-type domain-containing protein n=1 Tax=Leifsonia williamsii TaxID=3035919 RepID=A0ABT8KG05_9MICO|nr:hypothetical protein [Leifsonia williamsii]MDN4616385.1 hypothetical protein [Leifsonia williamsii]